MDERLIVSGKLESASKKLEVSIEIWASFAKILHGNDACTYRVTKQVAPDTVWDCGIIHLRKPWKVPRKEMMGLIADDFSEKEFRENWVELIAVLKQTAKTDEINQQQLIIQSFLRNFAFPITRSIKAPSRQIQKFLWQVVERIPRDSENKIWIDKAGGLFPFEANAPTTLPPRRGKKQLTKDELDEWANTVCEAMKLKTRNKKWSAIAVKLKVPERTLRYWRHDERIKELLRGRDCKAS